MGNVPHFLYFVYNFTEMFILISLNNKYNDIFCIIAVYCEFVVSPKTKGLTLKYTFMCMYVHILYFYINNMLYNYLVFV